MDTTPARVIREVGTNPSPQQLLEKATGVAANFGWNIKVRSSLVYSPTREERTLMFHPKLAATPVAFSRSWGEYEPGALLCALFSVRDREESSLLTGRNRYSADLPPVIMSVLQIAKH